MAGLRDPATTPLSRVPAQLRWAFSRHTVVTAVSSSVTKGLLRKVRMGRTFVSVGIIPVIEPVTTSSRGTTTTFMTALNPGSPSLLTLVRRVMRLGILTTHPPL